MTSPESFRVSTLELFFDLVFVFTFIQLSESLAHELTPLRFAESMLILAVVWWMYSGYAWLTNAVAPTSTTRRTLLLTGMGGFLVLALAIPEAFGADGWLFGLSYLVVTVVHAVLFTLARPESARAMRLVSALNIGAALLVLAGGLLEPPYRYFLLLAAVLVQFAVGHLRRLGVHDIAAGHFVERHRVVAGLGVLATIPLSQVSAVAQLGAILTILIAAAISEDLPGIRRAGSTAITDFGRTPG